MGSPGSSTEIPARATQAITRKESKLVKVYKERRMVPFRRKEFGRITNICFVMRLSHHSPKMLMPKKSKKRWNFNFLEKNVNKKSKMRLNSMILTNS